MKNADLVYTLGSGASSHLALAASYHIALNQKRSINLNQIAAGYDEQLMCADPKRDIRWVYSFPPYSSPVLSSIELALNRGMKTLAITDSHLSPVSRKADHVLFAANGSIVPINSQASAQLLIKGLLVQDESL